MVAGVAYDARGVSTADSGGLEGVQLAVGCGCVIPGSIHIDADQDRPMGGEPRAPIGQVPLQVEIRRNAACRQRGKERVFVSQVHVSGYVEGQQRFGRRAVFAQYVHASLESGASSLDESFWP